MAGFLDFLGGVAQGADEQIRARQKQRMELQQKIQEVYASEAIKSQFDPESRAKSQVFNLIQSLAPQLAPKPLGGYNLQEQAAGLPQQVQDRQKLTLFEESGLLPRQASPTSIYAFNPTTGQTTAAGVVPPHAKVFTTGQAGTTPQSDVEIVAQGIAQGTIAPDAIDVSYRDRTRVNAALQRKGIDLTKLQTDYQAMKRTVQSANSTQQLRMRQALESVRQSIPILRQASITFDRLGFRPLTWAQLTAAMTGADPTKRDVATRFVTQINVMQDELAQGFMGGGVPTDRAFQLAKDVLSPLYGQQQLGAALDQLETNVAVRLHAIQSTPPITLGGPLSPQLSRFGGQLSTGQAPQVPVVQPQTFSSESEAEAANLPPGTVVVINGRRARIQ